MSQKEKLIMRLKSNPKDFSFGEAETLLGFFNYRCSNKGHTSGSRVRFVSSSRAYLDLHRPHPGQILKPYQVKQLLTFLEQEGHI